MIDYIGDISKNDALVLKEMAEGATSILEFGCGASTQVLVNYATNLSVISIDTSEEWIERTFKNVKLLSPYKVYHGDAYNSFWEKVNGENPFWNTCKFDFVFDDGVDHLRREFAIKIWPYLKVGGILAFHDTRRAPDFRNVLEVLATFQDEIGKVEFNYKSSNITLVHKKERESYDNWQISENKEAWMLGYNEPPQEFIDKVKGLR